MALAQCEVTVEECQAQALKQPDPLRWAEAMIRSAEGRLEMMNELGEIKDAAREQIRRIGQALVDRLSATQWAA